jgi:hypothetical protein
MARVTSPQGHTRVVKNLSWFFRKAQKTPIRSIVLTHVEHSYVMEAVFDDSYIFVTPYASMEVFKRTMGRRRSLRGESVTVIDKDKAHEITIGSKS